VDSLLGVVAAAGQGDLTQTVASRGKRRGGPVGRGAEPVPGRSAGQHSGGSRQRDGPGPGVGLADGGEPGRWGQRGGDGGQANVVSAAAEQVSRNVQTVATGTEEMGASIREIAKNASDAARWRPTR